MEISSLNVKKNLKPMKKKIKDLDRHLQFTKANRNMKAGSLDSTKSMIEKAKTNKKGKTNDYILTGKETQEEFNKMMTDKNGRIVFR